MTRILVVDDNKLIRHLICELLLEDPQFEVVGQAADGLAAIRQAAALQPDLVTMDVQMPHLNGFDAAEGIHLVSPRSSVVFVSGDCTEECMERAYECGASAFVAKHRLGDQLLLAIRMVEAGLTRPVMTQPTVIDFDARY